MRPVENLLVRLEGVQERNGHWMARCPAHEDVSPSLSVKEGEDGRALLKCFRGCEPDDIVAVLELEMRDLFPDRSEGLASPGRDPTASYEVRDAAGELQAVHVRYDKPEGKDCFWRLPDTRGWGLKGRKLNTLPLYRTHLVRDWPEDAPVVIVEGEKAADALASIYPAVLGTVTGASGTPGPETLEALRGRRAVVWPDNDDEGRRHMERLAGELANIASEVRTFAWEDAPPKGDAADHPAVSSRGRDDVEGLLVAFRDAPIRRPRLSSSSLPPGESDDDDEDATPSGPVFFAEMGAPAEREFLVEDLLPARYLTTLYGTGGVAKSLLAMKLGIAVAGGAKDWLGLAVLGHGPVLYLDFELDADEQLRRVRELCAGARTAVPKNLAYLSAVGTRTQDAFSLALGACERLGTRLVILDSMGPAMLGDAERASDFLAFHNRYLAPFRAAGASVLAVDHQAKLQAGETYASKGAFGTSYKSHLSRSMIQVEKVRHEREAGTLTVRLRHRKTNFGPQRDPLDVELLFRPGAISTNASEVDAADLAGEETLNAHQRVELALKAGPAYPDELAERTGLSKGTVGNALTGLKKAGTVELAGQTKGKAQQVRLSSSSSLSLRGGDDDDGATVPLAYDLAPGETATVAELAARRNGSRRQ